MKCFTTERRKSPSHSLDWAVAAVVLMLSIETITVSVLFFIAVTTTTGETLNAVVQVTDSLAALPALDFASVRLWCWSAETPVNEE